MYKDKPREDAKICKRLIFLPKTLGFITEVNRKFSAAIKMAHRCCTIKPVLEAIFRLADLPENYDKEELQG